MTGALRDRLQTALGSRYTIERALGGGGMSETFVAHDVLLDRRIVVKIAMLGGEDSIDRFRREIALAATLQHPNLVTVLDGGVVDGLPYYTMPYVSGESLRARIASGGLPLPDAIAFLRDMARGLGAAHEAGIVHRDVKPDNVLLTGDAAILIDLGIAKATGVRGEDASALTKAGFSLGSPAYFAPEQASGEEIDARADWYAFGVTAFEMLTGTLPFNASTDAALVIAHVTSPAPDITQRRADVPPALAALVMQCLAKAPADRPQNGSDVVSALDRATAQLDQSRTSKAGARTSARPAARSRAAVVWGAVAVVAIIAIGMAVLRTRRPHADPLPAAETIVKAAEQKVSVAPQIIVAELPETSAVWRAHSESARSALRAAISGFPGIRLAPADTVFSDTSSARAFARSTKNVVLVLQRTARRDSLFASIIIFTGESRNVCATRASVRSERQMKDAFETVALRAAGALSHRYDDAMDWRIYRRPASQLELGRETSCLMVRLDAMSAYAAYASDSTRPPEARMADLEHALALEPTWYRPRVDFLRARGDTGGFRRLQDSSRASLGTLQSEPIALLEETRRRVAAGQMAGVLLAGPAIFAGRPREALRAVERAEQDTANAERTAQMANWFRAWALYEMGQDSAVIKVALQSLGPNQLSAAPLGIRSAAALGDTVRWKAFYETTALNPVTRLEGAARSGDVAAGAGHDAIAATFYRKVAEEGAALLGTPRSTPRIQYNVAVARRMLNDFQGADTLLVGLLSSSNAVNALEARMLRVLLALDRKDATSLSTGEAWLREEADTRHNPDAAIMLARLEARRGHASAALQWIRRALALGLSRNFHGDLRAIPEFRALRKIPEARAILLPVD